MSPSVFLIGVLLAVVYLGSLVTLLVLDVSGIVCGAGVLGSDAAEGSSVSLGCHGCDLNAPIFALFLRIFILCFRAATVVAKYGFFSARLQHMHGLYLV
jgi:hypothetical protein